VYWEAFPDARLEVARSIEEGSLAAVEGTMSGTHSGVLRTPEGEIPPTGRRVEIRWMAIYGLASAPPAETAAGG
jgi:predicted ester cyclase